MKINKCPFCKSSNVYVCINVCRCATDCECIGFTVVECHECYSVGPKEYFISPRGKKQTRELMALAIKKWNKSSSFFNFMEYFF